jgi:hypothetical protein
MLKIVFSSFCYCLGAAYVLVSVILFLLARSFIDSIFNIQEILFFKDLNSYPFFTFKNLTNSTSGSAQWSGWYWTPATRP